MIYWKSKTLLVKPEDTYGVDSAPTGSANAILALNEGAKMGGFYHNTGEGGMSRFHLQGGGSLVWNIGTGYFGCGSGSLHRVFDPEMFRENATRENCKMVEIKLSQGAKPAHGGMLPRAKITEAIAEARGLAFPATADCNSPPTHSAFSSPAELCAFIARLRDLSGGKPVGFKVCLGACVRFCVYFFFGIIGASGPSIIHLVASLKERRTVREPLFIFSSLLFPVSA